MMFLNLIGVVIGGFALFCWLRSRAHHQALVAVAKVFNQSGQGVMIFNARNMLSYSDEYAVRSVAFLAQDDMRTIGFFDCLGHLGMQAQRAALVLGRDVVESVAKPKNGHFKEIVLKANGGFMMVEAMRLADGRRALVLSDYEADSQEGAQHDHAKRKALVRMAAGVVHAYNNSLSIMYGHIRMLKTTADIDHTAERITQSMQRMSDLNDKMMQFCAVPVSLNAHVNVVDRLQDRHAPFYKALPKTVMLDLVAEVDVAHIATYEGGFDSIMQALVDRAVFAMSGNGQLCVHLDTHKFNGADYVRVSVSDNGTGMTLSDRARLFDPYCEVDAAGADEFGLSVMAGIVQQHGGFIHVETTPHNGSCFQVSLPRAINVVLKQAAGSMDDPQSIRLDGHCVLLVDDEKPVLDMVALMLEDLGMKVLKANSANEALLMQDSYAGQIDLILTDVVMPDVNGMQLREMLLAMDPALKIVFMSGFPRRGNAAKVDVPVECDLIPKPFNQDAMAMILYQHLVDEGGDDVRSTEYEVRSTVREAVS